MGTTKTEVQYEINRNSLSVFRLQFATAWTAFYSSEARNNIILYLSILLHLKNSLIIKQSEKNGYTWWWLIIAETCCVYVTSEQNKNNKFDARRTEVNCLIISELEITVTSVRFGKVFLLKIRSMCSSKIRKLQIKIASVRSEEEASYLDRNP
jgi:hypothetical protein